MNTQTPDKVGADSSSPLKRVVRELEVAQDEQRRLFIEATTGDGPRQVDYAGGLMRVLLVIGDCKARLKPLSREALRQI